MGRRFGHVPICELLRDLPYSIGARTYKAWFKQFEEHVQIIPQPCHPSLLEHCKRVVWMWLSLTFGDVVECLKICGCIEPTATDVRSCAAAGFVNPGEISGASEARDIEDL